MRRTRTRSTKIGDLFCVQLDDGRRKFFQFISFDLLLFNSDVIRVFQTRFSADETPTFEQIIGSPVEFYAHCDTRYGLKLGAWEWVGNCPEVGPLDKIIFRGSWDSGKKVGEQNVEISHNWYVWRLGDADVTEVGKLKGENRTADIGVVTNYVDLVDTIKKGSSQYFYPGFE